MTADIVYQPLARKVWTVLLACLFISGIIWGAPAPVFAQPALQTGAPDLAVTQTADQAQITVGDPIGFTIQIANIGGDRPRELRSAIPCPPAPCSAGR